MVMLEEEKKRLSELLKDTEDDNSEMQVHEVQEYESRLICNPDSMVLCSEYKFTFVLF